MKALKHGLIASVSLALVVLVLPALDDITTGSEPSLRLEWLTVGASLTWFLALAIVGVRRR